MKKIITTVFAFLIAASLFADAANNWLRLESLGEDRTLAGALVPSGTVYNVMHDAATILSNATDEVGWYPESVAQVWDVAENAPFTNGVFKFVLFDNTHGAGAIVRYLDEKPVEAGKIIKLSAQEGTPYEIADTNKLNDVPILVGADVTLNLRGLRADYKIDPASTGTIDVMLTDEEVDAYYDDEPIKIPLSSDGTFAGTLRLIDTDGETELVSAVEVVEVGGSYYLAATRAEVEAGYIDIPLEVTSMNNMKLVATGNFGDGEFSFTTNITATSSGTGKNVERNDSNSGSGMGGSGNWFFYSTDSACCSFIKDSHYLAYNCRLNAQSGSATYWQFDFPIDFGDKVFNLGSVQAEYFLCNGQGKAQGTNPDNDKRAVKSTVTIVDTNTTSGDGNTGLFLYPGTGTNTMNFVTSQALTGKVTLRLKVWFDTTYSGQAYSYSGCTGIKLIEAGGSEYTAMLDEDKNFSGLTWAPRRIKPTAEDHLIVKARAENLTLTLDEAVTCAVLRVTGEVPSVTIDNSSSQDHAIGMIDVAGLDAAFTATGSGTLNIEADSAATISGWTGAGSAITGAGTLVIDTGAKATEFTVSSFSSFSGAVVIRQGTWNAASAFPQTTPFTIDGENAVLTIGNDKTGYSSSDYPAITVANGGTLTFSSRDTFSRGLVLENGGNLVFSQDDLQGGRAFDFYSYSSLTVNGTAACRIGATSDGVSNSGIVCIRRSDLPITVNEGATLNVYSQWGYNAASSLNNACVKDGAGLIAFYRAPAQTGAFTVNGGTLKLVNAGAPTTGTITMAAGTTLECLTSKNVTQTLATIVANGCAVSITGEGITKLTSDIPNSTIDVASGATLDLNGHAVGTLTGSGTVMDSAGTAKLSFSGTFSPTLTYNCSIELADDIVISVASEEAVNNLVGENGSVTALGRATIIIDGSETDKNWDVEGRGFAAQPFDSISVNIKGGNKNRAAQSIADANTAGVVPMLGSQWSQVVTRSASGSVDGALDSGDKIYEVQASGSRVESDIVVKPYAACCYTAQGVSTVSTGNGELMYGYLDDGGKYDSGNKGAAFEVTGIAYTNYTLYVYMATDQGDSSGKKFGPVYVNGVAYPSEAGWGSPAAVHESATSPIKLVNGQNFVKVTGLTESALTIVGSKGGSPTDTRCGIAGFQIINNDKTPRDYNLGWNGSAWTNAVGEVTAVTTKSILNARDGDEIAYNTAVTPASFLLPESGTVRLSGQNNLGAIAVNIPAATTFEFTSDAAFAGTISGAGKLKLNPGQVSYDGQAKLPSTVFSEFTGSLQLASGRMRDNTAAYPAGMTVEILDGAQLYFNKSVSWPCAFIARGNGWTGTDNAIAKAGPMRCENGVTITGNVTFDNGDSAPNFVAWGNTCTINGYVTATNGLTITGNGGTLKFSAPFSCSNVKGTVTLVGGNLTFGNGSAGSIYSEFKCGDKIVIESNRTFTLHTRTDSVVDTSTSNKAKFVTPIDLDGGTMHIEDGSYVFSGDVTVNSDSTMVFKWKKGRVFQSLKGSAVLNVKATSNNGKEGDGYAVFRGGDFSGTIRSLANSSNAENLYIVPIGTALAKATVDLQSNGKLKITEAATIGGLDGAKPITIDNGATETQTLTIANGGTVSLLTDTSTAAIASTANLNLSGAVIDLNATTTTPVAEDSTETYWLAKAPSITTNGVKMAKGTWAFTVEKVDGNDVLKAQKTAKGFYIIIADNKQVSHDDEAKNAVNIDRDWIKTATAKDDNPITDDSSESDVETALNEKRANNVSLWENYVLGLEKDVSTSIPVVTPVQTSDADSISFALGNVKVNDAAGANVTYTVLTCDTLGGEYVEESEAVAHDKTVAVDLPESGVKYYKFEVDVSSK